MRDENGKLTMTFEQQRYFCMSTLNLPLRTLENIARALNPVEYNRIRYYYKKSVQSTCTYRAWLTLVIYDNDFMKKVFQVDNALIQDE